MSENIVHTKEDFELAHVMVTHLVILKQKMVLDQFTQGLHIGGVLEILRNHHEEFWRLFRGTTSSLTMDMLENMVVFNYGNIQTG